MTVKEQERSYNYSDIIGNSLPRLPGGPTVKIPGSQGRGPRFRSLVRELDTTCLNED